MRNAPASRRDATAPGATTVPPALPRAPVLDWDNFRRPRGPSSHPPAPSVESLAQTTYTTSGRAAIYQALRQLALHPGSEVLVPTYHCPTMVAPILRAGLTPIYFGLRTDGLPDLDELSSRPVMAARAMIVAHYFGLPRSLADVRAWCDARGIALIEDCAHCYFGQAGPRQVGAWGDYATASLSKFFPVPEAGLLGSASREIRPLSLRSQGTKAELKGCVDVLEFASRHRRLSGLRPLLAFVFALKNRRARSAPATAVPPVSDSVEMMMEVCDMARVGDAPLWASMALHDALPRDRILARRRENFALYLGAFRDVRGARPLFAEPPEATAPYVFPLWVDDADRVYQSIRALELPIFRWDRIWAGTPALEGDSGPLWSRHVLQLLCHQDLRPQDIAGTVRSVLSVLARSPAHMSTAAGEPIGPHANACGSPHKFAA